jgi:hypothetical protein
MKGVVPEGEELMPHRSSETIANTGGNNHTEAEVPLATPSTTIKKLCRNRGLVSQDEMMVTGAQGAMGANDAMEDEMVAAMDVAEAVGEKMVATEAEEVMGDKMVKERKDMNLAYKRRRLFQDG